MDDRGRFYADDNTKAALEDRAGRRLDIRSGKPPKDAIRIDSAEIAMELAGMNRRARRIFMSERRRGKSEYEAFAAIGDVDPR